MRVEFWGIEVKQTLCSDLLSVLRPASESYWHQATLALNAPYGPQRLTDSNPLFSIPEGPLYSVGHTVSGPNESWMSERR